MPSFPEGRRFATWDEHCFPRERREALYICAGAAVLVPAWGLIDAAFEPRLVRLSLTLRALATAVALGFLAVALRARTVRTARFAIAGALLASAALIARLVALADHFAPYLFGYSLWFWAVGFGASWPLAWGASALGLLLALLAGALAFSPGARTLADLQVAAGYLGSATIIGALATYGRRRNAREVFDATRAVEERNRDLKEALDRLGDAQARLVAAEKLSAMGRMLAGLSHEINNPLNVLQNNLPPLREHVAALVEVAELAQRGEAEDLRRRLEALDVAFVAEDVKDALGLMVEGVDRVRQIHRELRAFIRGDEVDPVPGDVNEGLLATINLLSRHVPPDVRVRHDLAPLPQTTFRPGALNQVWHNLIQNALDAVGTAGRIEVSSKARGAWIEVSVTDDGPGVALAHRSRLFEPFFTTKDVGTGTGLGLATSYQIVREHGGTLALAPDAAPGACFVVRLPVTSPSAGDDGAEPPRLLAAAPRPG